MNADAADPTPPVLAGESVTFTGTLASMTHADAARLVGGHGGEATAHLTRHTTMLVVGEEGWPLETDGHPSQKYRQAQSWRAVGAPLRVIRESDWLGALGLSDRTREVHRLYTPAMLEQMLGVTVALIRRWEQIGLLTAAKRVCRLPYFDFQEVARLGRLSELLESGVPARQLERSLAAIEQLFPEASQPRSALPLLAQGRELLVEDQGGLLEPISRQRIFDFHEPEGSDETNTHESPPSLPFHSSHTQFATAERTTASEWSQRGCDLVSAGDAAGAVEAFRMSLMLAPVHAETQFLLADALYQSGQPEAALERYYVVVETARDFIAAWVQIGSLHAARGEREAAVSAFRLALAQHPDYPEAHLQLGEVLASLGRDEEAAEHFWRYLDFDDRGPWAELARQRLGEEPAEEEGEHFSG